jgi:hypothetical protein
MGGVSVFRGVGVCKVEKVWEKFGVICVGFSV